MQNKERKEYLEAIKTILNQVCDSIEDLINKDGKNPSFSHDSLVTTILNKMRLDNVEHQLQRTIDNQKKEIIDLKSKINNLENMLLDYKISKEK